MLNQLRINHFAVIDEVIVDFESGSSVLTGETGAGKSILLDALSMVLGDRADKTAVRHGHDRADITAIFDIADQPAARDWLKEQEMDVDDDVIMRRTISSDGKSKAFINGTPTTLQSMRTLGEMLVDIHGQHEHQSLMKGDVQRQRLDRFAHNESLLHTLQAQQQSIKATQKALKELQGPSDDREERIELLQFQTDELEKLAIQENEWENITEEHKRLTNGGRLLDTANRAIYQLYESENDNVNSILGRIQYEIDELSDVDPKLKAVSENLETTTINLRESVDALNSYASSLDINPQRIEWLDQRMTAINDLCRKHRVEPEALNTLFETLSHELERLSSAGDNIEKLQQELSKQREAYMSTALKISTSRKKAAKKISEQVSQYMQAMGMPGGQFAINIDSNSDDNLTAHGLDNIEYQVSSNPGLPLRSLRKVASGGELSRISLAIQMATVEAETIPTLIFDEVDSGIGGGIAEVVGQHLSQLAEHRQVLCITHLPQVAAQAHNHLFVSKAASDSSTTKSEVNKLTQEQRIEEVARMLGGVELTEQSLLHAKEMLKIAS